MERVDTSSKNERIARKACNDVGREEERKKIN